jgi:hypothetical protein
MVASGEFEEVARVSARESRACIDRTDSEQAFIIPPVYRQDARATINPFDSALILQLVRAAFC